MRFTTVLGASVLLGAALHAQGLSNSDHFLYYKFNTGAGDQVINFGGATGAPGDGTIMSNAGATNWAAGRFNGGLSGSDSSSSTAYNYVSSGWTGFSGGSWTVAWFMRQNGTSAPGTSLSYAFSGLGSFRCFTGGVANNGLYIRAWGGAPSDLTTSVDIQAAAASNWVHVALVVDAAALTATYYIDGVPQPAITLTSAATSISGTSFNVGKHTSNTSSFGYDMDEFRFLNRAATPVEVRTWASNADAMDARYGAGCGAKLGSNNGPPAVGTPTYQNVLSGSANAPFVFSIGSSRTLLNFDLGLFDPNLAGCQWESNFAIVLSGVTDGSGMGTIPLPIVAPTLAGIVLYNQALVLPPSSTLESSNGVAVTIRP